MTTTNVTLHPNAFDPDEEALYVLFAASQLAKPDNTLITIDLLLAGLYLVGFTRLAPYFRSSEMVASFVATEYALKLPIWIYWAQLVAAIDLQKGFVMHKLSSDAQELVSQAAQSASTSQRKAGLLDFCSAVNESRLEACKKFIASGIDIGRMLQESAHRPG